MRTKGLLGTLYDQLRGKATTTDEGTAQSKTPTVLGSSADTFLLTRKDLYDMGQELALTSGDTRVDPEELDSGMAHAQAMAEEQAALEYDPRQNYHDKIKEEEYQRLQDKKVETEKLVRTAEDEVRRLRNAKAEVASSLKKPRMPMMLFFLGAFLIAITIAPSIRDFFFAGVEDETLGWYLSLFGGLVSGMAIAWALLGTFETTASKRSAHWMGLAAGVLFGLSFGLLRFTAADSSSGALLAIALTVLEISVVLILEWVGRGLRKTYERYCSEFESFDQRSKLLVAAQEELEYCKKQVQNIQERIDQHTSQIFEREARRNQIKSLVNGSRKAFKDGFIKGVAKNRQRARGGNYQNKEDNHA